MPMILMPSYVDVVNVGSMRLNSKDANSLVRLSNGDLTVTNDAGVYSSIRANRGFSSGRVYWEVTFLYGSSAGYGHYAYFAGVSLLGSDINLIPGYNMPDAYCAFDYMNYDARARVYGCYLDVDAGTFVVHRDGVLWVGSRILRQQVEQGVLSPVGGKWYPIVSPVLGDIVSCNFGSSSFVYSPVGGYIGAEYAV